MSDSLYFIQLFALMILGLFFLTIIKIGEDWVKKQKNNLQWDSFKRAESYINKEIKNITLKKAALNRLCLHKSEWLELEEEELYINTIEDKELKKSLLKQLKLKKLETKKNWNFDDL